MSGYMVELLASNDHNELEVLINGWLATVNPSRILQIAFVADGSQYSYAVLILYVPGEKSLAE